MYPMFIIPEKLCEDNLGHLVLEDANVVREGQDDVENHVLEHVGI